MLIFFFPENDEPLVPGGDGQEEAKKPHEKSEPYQSKSYHVVSDWRDFRANLVAREKVCSHVYLYATLLLKSLAPM
jgi:hypothetical protein